MKSRNFAELEFAIVCDARKAFSELAQRTDTERLYGFAIYSDDSLLGFDAAVNTMEFYQQKCERPRTCRFEAYWYTTEWKLEGGVASCFEQTNAILATLDSAFDIAVFREHVLQALENAMRRLVAEGFFQRLATSNDTLVEISISDSHDDERIMEQSIESLNQKETWERYLNEKKMAGY